MHTRAHVHFMCGHPTELTHSHTHIFTHLHTRPSPHPLLAHHMYSMNQTFVCSPCHTRTDSRAVNHVRQYFAMAKCADALASFKLQRFATGLERVPHKSGDSQVNTDSMYSVAVRVRDDVVLPIAVDVRAIIKLASQPNAVVTPQCQHWGGVNDKMAFVNPLSAELYFRAPMHTVSAELPLFAFVICSVS